MEIPQIHVVHVSPWRLPVSGYGGSQRVLAWLVEAQRTMGIPVTLFAPPGTTLPGVTVVHVSARPDSRRFFDEVVRQLPPDASLIHFQQFPLVEECPLPWLATVHGNSPGELAAHPHKVFLSQSHAERGGSAAYVYNGLDPSEYIYRERKDDYFLFLAKVSRRSKGIDVALRLAHKLGLRLVVAGGTRWDLRKTGGWWTSWRCRAEFLGEVDGRTKVELLANARALLFPIRWEEPFGLAVIEALVSGTPVITAPLGAMPEIVTPDVGFLCASFDEFCSAIAQVETISPQACRQRVLEHFTHRHMAAGYLRHYLRVLATASRTPPALGGAMGDAEETNEASLASNRHG